MDIGIERANIKPKRGLNKFFKKLFFVFLFFCFLVFLIIARVQTKYSDKIVGSASLLPPNIGLVFGAGLKAGGAPSPVLEERILAAIRLFQDGRVGKFILSGYKTDNHDEVAAMKNLALAEGLPEDAILLDDIGTSTFDSCRNVKEYFGLNKIVLISQKNHLRRALYICNEMGIDAVGVASEPSKKDWQSAARELLASVYAWFKVIF
ncbi:YdcF family protein [Candidatus Falkowbacteria bacterium]|nr:YdcF family protein [Candidatus Falkowbacteria bacterium]